MTYKLKSKKEKEQYLYILKHNIPRNVKERYLRQTGLFKEQAIQEMSDKQLNEMVEVGLKVKGVIKE
jgi:hypothetical protein